MAKGHVSDALPDTEPTVPWLALSTHNGLAGPQSRKHMAAGSK